MFALVDWIKGKPTHNHHDDDDIYYDEQEENNKTSDRLYPRKIVETNDYYEEEEGDDLDDIDRGGGGDEDGEWEKKQALIGDYDDVDYVFFAKLEEVHRFNQGELLEFYHSVREAYIFELLSMNTRNIATLRQSIDIYVGNFLGYLSPTYQQDKEQEEERRLNGRNKNDDDDIPVLRVYPRLIYLPVMNFSTPSLATGQIDDESCAYRVDKRLDFVYAYVIEKGIIDTLKKKGEQMLQYQNNECQFMELLLDNIETFNGMYRMRVNSQYIANDTDTSVMGLDKKSDSWIIYTRRSCLFFKRCMQVVKSHNQDGMIYSDTTLRIEPIPFQQVLLMCGNYPGFIEKYCATSSSQRDGPVTVNVTDADDWVSVPVWFQILIKMYPFLGEQH